MSYFSVIMLLASILALGQAAPVSSKAQRYYGGPLYQQAINNLNSLATEESVDPAELFRTAARLLDAINDQQAREQWSVSVGFPLAEAERANYGDVARGVGNLIDAFGKPNDGKKVDYGGVSRGIGDLIDAFGKKQEAAAKQEELASEQRSLHREDYGRILGALGGLVG